MRFAQELALGVYGPVTTRSQLYIALVASWLQKAHEVARLWRLKKHKISGSKKQVAFSSSLICLITSMSFACFLWFCGHRVLQDFGSHPRPASISIFARTLRRASEPDLAIPLSQSQTCDLVWLKDIAKTLWTVNLSIFFLESQACTVSILGF